MSRFEKLSHVIWHCHIVWVPKYRYRVLQGKVAYEVGKSVRVHSERLGCQIVELSIQPDHVHLLVKVPPKVSISVLLGRVKGRTAIQIFRQFPYLKEKPYWGNHFWAIHRACLGWKIKMDKYGGLHNVFSNKLQSSLRGQMWGVLFKSGELNEY